MSTPAEFISLPADAYPFTIEFLAVTTGEVVYTITVAGPGAVLVPALRASYGPVRARMTYADGTVVE